MHLLLIVMRFILIIMLLVRFKYVLDIGCYDFYAFYIDYCNFLYICINCFDYYALLWLLIR